MSRRPRKVQPFHPAGFQVVADQKGVRAEPVIDLVRLVPCCERDHNGDGDCDRHPNGLYGVAPQAEEKTCAVSET